jgi:glycosyltransferase involved in cell wall biosynthesis
LPRNLFISCPVGCNEDIFSPRTHKKFYERTQVTYYTSYLPVHGVDIVVKAALKLRSEPINFRIIGRGQTYKSVRKLAGRYMLDNIEFLPEMPIEKIADQIAISDICLGGHFGSTEKASRVVPGKVYQILAMQRPLIASNTSANLDLFQDSEAALLCPNGDPDALADAILCLHEDSQFRESLAAKGRQLYLEKCSEVVITDILRKTIIGLLKE